MKKFDFDNGMSQNIFSHPNISYMANERLQEEEQLHSKNYLLEMLCSHAKMRLKSLEWQQLYQEVIHEVVAANALACFCIIMHS